jgi:uncharacterized protein
MNINYLKALSSTLFLAVAGCATPGAGPAADDSWARPARIIVDPESGRPYRIETAFIPSGKDRIASTLLSPDGTGPAPVLIAVSGAGEGLLAPESPVFRRLVSNGYAVLALGKKGVGASSGNWRKESFQDRARNVTAAMDWVSTRTDIDGSRIILYGHSQGGYVVPLVHSDARVEALVLAAGPARTVRDQIVDHEVSAAVFMGLGEQQAQAKALRTRRLLDVTMRVCPVARFHYLCNVYHFDPAPALSAIEKPVLVLFNELDEMVPPTTNLEAMRTLLAANSNARIRVLPQADHSHIKNPSGLQGNHHKLLGPVARFPHALEGDPDHARLAELRINRLPLAEGYVGAVEDFVSHYVPLQGRVATSGGQAEQ